MSRIGKKAIHIPAKTTVAVVEDEIVVTGPLGELKRQLHPEVRVVVEGGEVSVAPVSETILSRALWGTFASHVINMIEGVQKPYVKKLIIEGVGYRGAMQGKNLVLNIGFSHPVTMPVPDGLTVTVEKNEIGISGIDIERVGQFASDVRRKKKPEPYKGKGIHYSDEVVRRKQGKKTA